MHPLIGTMVREYIARDPRTGLPIATGLRQTRKTNKKERIGPWLECTRQELHDLSTGQTEQLTVNWNGGRHTLSRVDGVQGLGRLKGVWADRAHASLLLALEHGATVPHRLPLIHPVLEACQPLSRTW